MFLIYFSQVVNCFQKLLSSWHDTTMSVVLWFSIMLWIAFKNYYLRDTTQLLLLWLLLLLCCELLSKIIIFVTRHNTNKCCIIKYSVVNCFQKLLSSWHDTTLRLHGEYYKGLWIAFKNYYLRDTTQLWLCQYGYVSSCELLSKIIIFVTRHNTYTIMPEQYYVVNCFQKLLSSWHDTTSPTFSANRL